MIRNKKTAVIFFAIPTYMLWQTILTGLSVL